MAHAAGGIMKWLESGNLVASAHEIGVCLEPVATWLPRGGLLEIHQELDDDRQRELRWNDGRALQ